MHNQILLGPLTVRQPRSSNTHVPGLQIPMSQGFKYPWTRVSNTHDSRASNTYDPGLQIPWTRATNTHDPSHGLQILITQCFRYPWTKASNTHEPVFQIPMTQVFKYQWTRVSNTHEPGLQIPMNQDLQRQNPFVVINSLFNSRLSRVSEFICFYFPEIVGSVARREDNLAFTILPCRGRVFKPDSKNKCLLSSAKQCVSSRSVQEAMAV